ncbi:MAG: hypothetical protein VXZ35_03345 [Pseudomonadota bacterium]|nr:hypothetical protein [Pseudomonadota bacterium]
MKSLTFKHATLYLIIALLVSACTPTQHRDATADQTITVITTPHPLSPFNIAKAHFEVPKSRRDIMMFLSTTARIPDWMAYVDGVTVVDYIDHNNYVIKARLDLPWPLRNRELVACVETSFLDNETVINMRNCPDRIPADSTIRVKGLEAQWRLHAMSGELTRVEYSTWIDLGGFVPAIGFNLLLKNTTQGSLQKLRNLMQSSHATAAY